MYFPVIPGLNIHIYALRATTYTTDNTGGREQTNKPREGGGLPVREEAGGIDGMFPRTLPPRNNPGRRAISADGRGALMLSRWDREAPEEPEGSARSPLPEVWDAWCEGYYPWE